MLGFWDSHWEEAGKDSLSGGREGNLQADGTLTVSVVIRDAGLLTLRNRTSPVRPMLPAPLSTHVWGMSTAYLKEGTKKEEFQEQVALEGPQSPESLRA